MTARRALLEGLRRRLVPALEQLGFTIVQLTEAEKRSAIGAAFPFGRLRRQTPQGFDLVEIQFDKDGSPAFRLNIGHVPREGIDHAIGHVAALDVWVHYLDRFATLYSSCWFRRWFRARKHTTDEGIEALVQGVIVMLPQVEDYLRTGRCGRNLRRA